MNTKILVALAAIAVSFGILPAKADVALNQVSSAGISAKITPLANETGAQKVYMGAFLPVTPGSPDGKWYLRDTSGNWLLYEGGPLPVALNITLPPPTNTPYIVASIADVDISALEGLQVWVAYGTSESAALADAKHVQKIYTVPAKKVLHYTEKVYALWTAGYPFAVTKTSAVRVTNKTSIAGIAPYMNCWLAEKPLADGKVLTDCQDVVSYNRHLLYIDPTTDELHEYETTPQVWDTTPTTPGRVCGWCNIYSYPAGTTWIDVQVYDPAYPTWGAKAKVSDGWFFTTDTAWVLNFQADATGLVTTVKAGTFSVDGTIKLLISYSN